MTGLLAVTRLLVVFLVMLAPLVAADVAWCEESQKHALMLSDTSSSGPTGDWPQLGRSGTSESRLPPDTIVQYSEPSTWRTHRWSIVTAVATIAIQALFIAWLLVEHRRRLRAEKEVGQRVQEARTQLVTITHLDRRAAMGEVTAAITHELNQPLEAILHNAEAGELLMESGAPSHEEIRHIFADIRRIDTRAAEIIRRLRSLLRKKEFEMGPIDVNELTRETAVLGVAVAASKGVRVELDLATESGQVVGDQLHLQQVLLNLILNGIEAMKATPRDFRRLAVRTTTVDHQVEVSVRDWGHGIPAEAVSRVFEPYYTTKGEGMGLGLSIARTIVETHGGRIAARNNPDGGATVWFTLPARETAEIPVLVGLNAQPSSAMLDVHAVETTGLDSFSTARTRVPLRSA